MNEKYTKNTRSMRKANHAVSSENPANACHHGWGGVIVFFAFLFRVDN